VTRRPIPYLVAGAAAGAGLRALVQRAILVKLRRDVRALNAGDPGPLLAGYAADAVLQFNDGPHRWAGTHAGKPAIERFLRDFVAAGLTGEIVGLWVAGPPWALSMAVRFDDRSVGEDGEELYANRTVLVVRTRWGRIVRQEDFYEDTGRIVELERKLTERGRGARAFVRATATGAR
jgi:ketosteroid isomerase-like protein